MVGRCLHPVKKKWNPNAPYHISALQYMWDFVLEQINNSSITSYTERFIVGFCLRV